MAIRLSQVVDLAIGTDIPSVNFVHLKEVLLTVIATLNIGDVVVKKTMGHDVTDTVLENNTDENDLLLSDEEDAEIVANTAPEDVDVNLVNLLTRNATETQKYQTTTEEIANKENYFGKSSVESTKEENTSRIKSAKNSETRHKVELSRVVNIDSSHDSLLFNKIQVLEEGLKRLQGIVDDLIFQGDSAGTSMERLENVGEKKYSKVKFVNPHRGTSARLLRDIPEEPLPRRPVTQPAGGKRGNVSSDYFRPGTRDELVDGKTLSSKKKMKETWRMTNITEEVDDNMKIENTGDTKDSQGDKAHEHDTTEDDKNDESNDNSEENGEKEAEIGEVIEEEIEASLNDPDDLNDPMYAVRLAMEEMEEWREKLSIVQEEMRVEVRTCRKSVDKLQNDLKNYRLAANAQEAERFNAVHHVHNMALELERKHERMNKTVNNLVDEFNRHDETFHEVFDVIEKFDEQKVDKVLLSSQVDEKANKDELHDKVSLSTFDETFSLLDRGLNDALEKMANQMSMEEALRETLNELESGMEAKLNREEMDKLKKELENRIKEVRSMQAKGLEGKPKTIGEPAGFKRKTETVRCISCDRDMEMTTNQVQVPPSIPKAQRLAGNHVNKAQSSRDDNKKVNDVADEHRVARLKTEMVQGTGLLDYTSFPMSQRFCGGRHTIMRASKRSQSTSHFNDYVVIRNESNSVVSLPSRDFVVPREMGVGSRFMRPKLPAIQEGGNNWSPEKSGDVVFLEQEEELGKTKKIEKKISYLGKVPVCKNEDD